MTGLLEKGEPGYHRLKEHSPKPALSCKPVGNAIPHHTTVLTHPVFAQLPTSFHSDGDRHRFTLSVTDLMSFGRFNVVAAAVFQQQFGSFNDGCHRFPGNVEIKGDTLFQKLIHSLDKGSSPVDHDAVDDDVG